MSNHPLPTPPGQQQRQDQQVRPRAKSSAFSFKSHHSSGSNHKIDLHETHEEKQAKRLHTKADPSMALNEAEPSAVANNVKSSIAPLRSIQHLDQSGNPIADPDRNNPTRSRWERPLDTIRSFEAAIDGGYRKQYGRAESAVGGDGQSTFNRRSSYYGGTQAGGDDRPRYQQNGYGRSQSYRPDSYYDRSNGNGRPDSYYYNNADNGPSNGYTPNRARYPRTASEPHYNHGGVYPIAGQQQSYETVTTAFGRGSSPDTIGYSTDPSSENSSMDRIAALPKEQADTYGFKGFGNTQQYALPMDQYSVQNNGYGHGNGYPDQAPPPPRKEVGPPQVPIKLGATSGNAGPNGRPGVGDKRKSWFGKRFSKNA